MEMRRSQNEINDREEIIKLDIISLTGKQSSA